MVKLYEIDMKRVTPVKLQRYGFHRCVPTKWYNEQKYSYQQKSGDNLQFTCNMLT